MPAATAYDLQAENDRLSFPDITLRGVTLNRATARIGLTGPIERPGLEDARARHRASSFTSTLDPHSPVLEPGWPVAGPYVRNPSGTYMDLYLGVAQKLLDENHPRLARVAQALLRHRLLFRREINTDDYILLTRDLEDVAGPTELAELFTALAGERWPDVGGFRAFLSNSGAEANEAALKLAWLVKYEKLVERYGFATFQRLMRDLGVPEVPYFSGEKTPVYADYPFVVVACEGSFHGRTLGALHATRSKAAHHYGYPKADAVLHIPYNAPRGTLAAKIDPRPLPELLEAAGGVRGVLDAGRVPADLLAGFLAEPLQGEGGYVPGEAAFFRDCEEACRRFDAMLIVDEVQTFGRSGTLWLTEQLGVTPDVLCMAKAAVVGVTLARAEYERYLHPGWHSNTFGGGKMFDTSFSYAIVDTLAHERPAVFAGLDYSENCRVKGEYLSEKLDGIAARHPDTVKGHEGRGLLHGITVRRRDAIIREGWARGLKLLGCGPAGDASRLRVLFLADTLAREIDDFARVFEDTVAAVEAPR